MKFEDMNMD